jgi:hypothetical protein
MMRGRRVSSRPIGEAMRISRISLTGTFPLLRRLQRGLFPEHSHCIALDLPVGCRKFVLPQQTQYQYYLRLHFCILGQQEPRDMGCGRGLTQISRDVHQPAFLSID